MTAPEPYSYRTHGSTDRFEDGEKVVYQKRRDDIQSIVDEWNANNPEIATPFGRENLARAYAFPSVGLIRQDAVREDGSVYTFEDMWRERFDRDPDLMWMMVGDVVRYVSSEEIPRGERVSSRRVAQERDRNLSSVWQILGIQSYSMDPFPVAVRELIGSRSLRWFAQRAGFGSVETLRRYMRGERPLTMDALEACAKAGRVEPFFWVEYRALWLSRELMRAMLANPNDSVRAVKEIKSAVV